MKRLASIILIIIMVVTDISVMAVDAKVLHSDMEIQTEGALTGRTEIEPGLEYTTAEEEATMEQESAPEEKSTMEEQSATEEESTMEEEPITEEKSTEEESATEEELTAEEETTEEETLPGGDGLVSGNAVSENSISANSVSLNKALQEQFKLDPLVGDSFAFMEKDIYIQQGFPEDMDTSSGDSVYMLPAAQQGNAYQADINKLDWAYSLCSAMESSYKKRTGNAVSFSAETLKEYLYSDSKSTTFDTYGKISGDTVKLSNTGGGGTGNIMTAMWAAASEYVFPKVGYQMENIWIYNGWERKVIQEAIKTRGEVITSLYRMDSFFQYEEGESYASEYRYSYYLPAQFMEEIMLLDLSNQKEHTVTIVGWDDKYPRRYFNNTPENDGAWLVKDAYGVNLEEKGKASYYWVSYYDSAFRGLPAKGGKQKQLVNFYSMDLAVADKTQHTYQFDGGSGNNAFGGLGYTKAVNIFPKAEAREVLESISFGTFTRNAKYKVQVYLDAEPANAQQKQPVLKRPVFEKPIVTEVLKRRGYYTVELGGRNYLNEPVLQKGLDESDYFAVEVEINTDGTNFIQGDLKSFWVDGSQFNDMPPVECFPDAAAVGQSYVFHSKTKKWLDFGQENPEWVIYPSGKGSNIRIKAHTRQQLYIVTNDVEKPGLWLGEQFLFKAMLGGKELVEGVSWHSSNTGVATVETISGNGLVKALKAGEIELTASHGSYGSHRVPFVTKEVLPPEPVSLMINSVKEERRKGQILCKFMPESYQPESITYELVNKEDSKYVSVERSTGKVLAEGGGGSKKNIPITVTIKDKTSEKKLVSYVNCIQVMKKFQITDGGQQKVEKLALKTGNKKQLTIHVLEPVGATSDALWKSSNPGVVAVNANGSIIAIKEGKATITALSGDDGTIKEQLSITVTGSAAGLSLSESYLSLEAGESKSITAKLFKGDFEKEGGTFSIRDTAGKELAFDNQVISFDQKTGIITAKQVSPGSKAVILWAECGDMKDSCYITVKSPVTGMNLSYSPTEFTSFREVTLSAGGLEEIPVYAILEPKGSALSDAVLFYRSSNPAVAKVSGQGKILPLKAGKAIITAETDTGLVSSVTLTVYSSYAGKQLTLNTDKLVIYSNGEPSGLHGKYASLSISVDGSVVLPKDFIWKSSDETIARVDQNGRVEAIAVGAVRITAADKMQSSNQQSISLETEALVKDILVERDRMELAKGKKLVPGYTISPQNAKNKEVKMISDNPAVVTVSGNYIWTMGEGETKLHFKSGDGVDKVVGIRVREKEAVRLQLSMDAAYQSEGCIYASGTGNSTAEIRAVALDELGQSGNVGQIFDYRSGSPMIAEVDGNGRVTGYQEGKAEIEVRAMDGSMANARIEVEVRKGKGGVKSLLLNYDKVELKPGETLQLFASVLPEQYHGGTEIKWSTPEEAPVRVSRSGLVSTAGVGTAIVTAETPDGNKKAECRITIHPMDKKIKLLKIKNQVLEIQGTNPHGFYQIEVLAQDGRDYRNYCEYSSSRQDVCTVDKNGLVKPTAGGKTGKSVITVTLKDDPLNRKIFFTVETVKESLTSNIRVWADTNMGEREITNTNPLYLKSQKGKTIKLRGYAVDGEGSYQKGTALDYAVSDSRIASIKKGKDGTAVLTLKGSGRFTITCTAKDKKKASVSFPVYVCDASLVLTEKNMEINLKKAGDIPLPVQAVKGSGITELQVAYTRAGSQLLEEGMFQTVKSGSQPGGYLLRCDAAKLRKGNYTLQLQAQVTFDNSPEGIALQAVYGGKASISQSMAIPVKITDSQPKVKISMPQLNVFEKNAAGKITIQTLETVESLTLSNGKKGTVTDKFRIEKTGQDYSIKAVTETKGSFSGILNVKLKGYPAPLTLSCSIKTNMLLPKLAISPGKLYAYKTKEGDAASIGFSMEQGGDKVKISPENGYVLSGDATLGSGGLITVNSGILSGYGTKMVKMVISNPSKWNRGIAMQIPVSVEKQEKVKVEADQKTILLNKKSVKDYCQLKLSFRQQNLTVESVSQILFLDSGGKTVDYFVYDASGIGEGKLKITLREGMDCPNGRYKLKMNVAASENLICPTEIPIQVEETAQTAKITLKGFIDPLNRLDTEVTGTMRMEHASAPIRAIASERNEFSAVYAEKEGRVIIKLKENESISGKKQLLILKITLQDGTIVRKAVTISLKETKVKWKQTEKLVFYKSAGASSGTVNVLSGQPDSLLQKGCSITITNKPEGISAISMGSNIIVELENRQMKPGKYKVTAVVRMNSSARDGQTLQKQLTVEVKE